MITLPSIHDGISLQVRNMDNSKNILLPAQQCFASLEAAWFRDTIIDISNIECGAFAALVYDIVDGNSDVVPASLSLGEQAISQVTEIRKLLNGWFDAPSKPKSPAKTLAYQISQFHSDKTLHLPTLDAQDSAVLNNLQLACKGTVYSVYLANISRHLEGFPDESSADPKAPNRMSQPPMGRYPEINLLSKERIEISRVVSFDRPNTNTRVQFNRE